MLVPSNILLWVTLVRYLFFWVEEGPCTPWNNDFNNQPLVAQGQDKTGLMVMIWDVLDLFINEITDRCTNGRMQLKFLRIIALLFRSKTRVCFLLLQS